MALLNSIKRLTDASSLLTIDLGAIVHNYKLLNAEFEYRRADPSLDEDIQCAAVVKADAYGTGVQNVAPALAGAGCDMFFVATLDEAILLRNTLPNIDIAVLSGLLPNTAPIFAQFNLVPVINDLGQLDRVVEWSRRDGIEVRAILHLDTGMNRMGLDEKETATLQKTHRRMYGPQWVCVMSHLACADIPGHEMSARQLSLFKQRLDKLPEMPVSLANSAGIFLGRDYHFDIARPGIALYGGNPLSSMKNPMRPVVRLVGRVLQVRTVPSGQTIGYGASFATKRKMRIATVGCGYADGYMRTLSDKGHVVHNNRRLPIVGRVSMDAITVDVSEVPENELNQGDLVELIGEHMTVDMVAEMAGTIANEVLTSLGQRYRRAWIGAPANDSAEVGQMTLEQMEEKEEDEGDIWVQETQPS